MSDLANAVVTSTDGSTGHRETTAKRIPCLDGLRAISIVMVLMAHVRWTQGFPRLPDMLMRSIGLFATAGVCLFFVISGYLITTLLLVEKEKTGRISLRKFYIRRTLRIFPAYYLFLMVALLLRHIGYADFSNVGFLASATYWRNFYDHNEWLLNHTWSLAIEEQFYLLWPLTLTLLSARRAIWIAALVVVGWPLMRFLRHGFLFAGTGNMVLNGAAGDTILYGCLLALLARHEKWLPRLQRLARYRRGLYLSLAILCVIYSTNEWWPRSLTFLLPLLRNLSLTWLLWWCVNNWRSPLGRALEWKPVAFVGLISYSLYVWQQVFLAPNKNIWFCRFPMNVLMALCTAALSYYIIERPLNALRHRFSAIHGHPQRTSSTVPVTQVREAPVKEPAVQ